MLEPLVRYAERMGFGDDPSFKAVDVKWVIELASDGTFLGVVALGDPNEKGWKGRHFARAPYTPPNEVQVWPCAHFLHEAATTVLDLPNPKEKPEKIEEAERKRPPKHAYFKKLVDDAIAANAKSLEPVQRFLSSSGCTAAGEALLKQKKAKMTDVVTFDVEGRAVLEESDWHNFWRGRRQGSAAARASGGRSGKDAARARPCFATGEIAASVKSHGALKVPGASSMGARLVCFDKDAFGSYGLEKGENAAISERAEARYRAALQDRIDNREWLGDTIFIHWTRDEARVDPMKAVMGGEADGVDLFGGDEKLMEGGLVAALRRVKAGGGASGGDAANVFYGCALSGEGARIAIRDWWESSLAEVFENAAAWFEDLGIVGMAKAPKFGAVLFSLVRKKLDELKGPLPVALMNAALRGFTIPREAMRAALRRHAIDVVNGDKVKPTRMGLVKACLNRLTKEKRMTTNLNRDETDRAYRCGRLIAVFEKIQWRALGNVNANVVQRFYGAASTTPALVFPRLFRMSKHHLRSVPGGLAWTYEKEIAEIVAKDLMGTEFPRVLTLEEQGRFALGYYHEKIYRASDEPEETADNEISETDEVED